MGRNNDQETMGNQYLNYHVDNPLWRYVEPEELWHRNIDTRTLVESDVEYDYEKRGYWVRLGTPTCDRIISEGCNLLASQRFSRR